MKKQSLLVMLLAIAVNSMAQYQSVFSIRPGLNLNGASFGFQKNKVQPFLGLRFANVKVVSEYTDSDYPADNYKTDTRVHVYMPCIGAKFFYSGNEVVKPYFLASLYKPFVFGKQLNDGREDDSFKESLNNIKVWAAELGIGYEYHFHSQFSVGGEFGLRWANLKDKFEPEDSSYTYSSSLNLGVSYISFSMNYYFLKEAE